MATRAFLAPEGAQYPSSNYPGFYKDGQDRTVLAFDGATNESCYWTIGAPQGWTTAFTLVITARCASATSGTFRFIAALEAITPGDTLDTDAASSFDSNNSAGASAPGTAGYLTTVTITLTNNDSSAAGDLVRLKLTRDATGSTGTDDITSDVEVLMVEVRDGA